MPSRELIPLIAVAAVTLFAAVTDVRRFKVPNKLTFPALLLGLVCSSLLGGFMGLGISFLGAVTGFAVLLVFYALGGVGAGDVKLFTALGSWLGPRLTIEVFVASAIAAGIYALVLVILQDGLGLAFFRFVELGRALLTPRSWGVPRAEVRREVSRPDRRRRLVPFAAMTCLAFFVTLAHRQLEPAQGHHESDLASNGRPIR